VRQAAAAAVVRASSCCWGKACVRLLLGLRGSSCCSHIGASGGVGTPPGERAAHTSDVVFDDEVVHVLAAADELASAVEWVFHLVRGAGLHN
jgi:hypothetical protein